MKFNFMLLCCQNMHQSVPLGYGQYVFGTKVCEGSILGWFMVFNDTFNNISVISWRSVLLV